MTGYEIDAIITGLRRSKTVPVHTLGTQGPGSSKFLNPSDRGGQCYEIMAGVSQIRALVALRTQRWHDVVVWKKDAKLGAVLVT
ncbi:hypothetical protein TNCV_4398701 [Trichonephila clavipes]|nr:hypothetical protein TNCV_4398701 [Trichonephila clavipes]